MPTIKNDIDENLLLKNNDNVPNPESELIDELRDESPFNSKHIWKEMSRAQEVRSVSMETLLSEPNQENAKMIKLQRINSRTNEFSGHKHIRSKFTALPFYNVIDEETPLKMVNVCNKHTKTSKYVVAPDGFIPNSKIRSIYPKFKYSEFGRKSSLEQLRDKEAKLIEDIITKHLNVDKIIGVKKAFKSKQQSKRKQHYQYDTEDLVTMNNEVIDNFNLELEKAKSEVSEEEKPKSKKVKDIPKRKKLRLLSLQKKGVPAKLDEQIVTRDSEDADPGEVQEDAVDIDILDKLEKKIEDFELHGNKDNKQVQERILKDRIHRISDRELKKYLGKLEMEFGSKNEVYKLIQMALKKDQDSLAKIESVVNGRQNRLGLLNTITDPFHLFDYMLQFYNNVSELLDDIQDVLNGTNILTFEKLINLSGDKQNLQSFLSGFVAAKNYALTVFSIKISNFNERTVILDQGLRGIYTDNVVFNVFMSSEEDARQFFKFILQCKIKEMMAIMEEMKKISSYQEKMESTTHFAKSEISSTAGISTLPWKDLSFPTFTKELVRTASHVSEKTKISGPMLPALPTYNEESWKVMMSQYLAQMVSNITPPSKKADTESQLPYKADKSFQESLRELGFMHHEILRLLKVYLNNDVVNAQKLLDGLVKEDELAYQAAIELIGEKEALQIIKSLRVKHDKIIQQIIDLQSSDEDIQEARVIYRSMQNILPQTLSSHLNQWLEAEKVEYKHIKEALRILTHDVSGSTEEIDYSFQAKMEIEDETSTAFFSQFTTRKNRFSILETMGSTQMGYVRKFDQESSTESRENIEVMPLGIGNVEVEYKGINVERDETIDTTISESIKFDATGKSKLPGLEPKIYLRSPIIEEPESKTLDKDIVETFEPIPIETTTIQSKESEKNYKDTLHVLSSTLAQSFELDKFKDVASVLINFTDTSKDHLKINEAIYDEIRGQIVSLLQEDKRPESMTKESIKIPIKTEDKLVRYHSTIEVDSQEELQDAIKQSYVKQQKIEVYIQILKKLEAGQSKEVEKILQNKRNACSLYPPEVRDQKDVLKVMGIESYQPFELFTPKVDIIMRKAKEELDRHTVTSLKLGTEDRHWEPGHSDGIFNALAEKSSTDIFEISSSSDVLSPIVGRESLFRFESYKTSEEKQKSKTPTSSDENAKKLEKLTKPVMKQPIHIKPLTLETLKAEIVSVDNILVKDESLEYQTGQARLLKRARFRKSKESQNPYSDFHVIYGPTSYYLPYINPTMLKKMKSGEEPIPRYDSKDDKETNSVFSNLQKLFSKSQSAEEMASNLFYQTRSMPRPSNVPLKDWIKLGAVGMASNMSVIDKCYKITKSRCRFQHLSKLNMHKYGLSNGKYIQRAELVDFIMKSNASYMSERLKSKLLQDRNVSSGSSSFTELLKARSY